MLAFVLRTTTRHDKNRTIFVNNLDLCEQVQNENDQEDADNEVYTFSYSLQKLKSLLFKCLINVMEKFSQLRIVHHHQQMRKVDHLVCPSRLPTLYDIFFVV